MPATLPLPPAIEVRDLTKRYGGVTAIHRLNFRVERGEVLGFLGPNGAGKSTTLRILAGYLPATEGAAWVAGHSVALEPRAVQRALGYMPENNPLPEELRVREYLRFRGRLKGLPGRRLGPRIDEVLEQCDLRRVSGRLIGNLSKGFRQRVGIADAILAEPAVAVLDEPTIGLDPHQIVLLRDLIGRLRGRLSLILSSHILPEVELLCDRVVILNGGHVVAAGTPEELRQGVAGGTTWTASLAGTEAAVVAALSQLHAGLRLVGRQPADPEGFSEHRLTIDSPPSGFDEDLFRHLASFPGLRVRALGRHRPTLEEVFLAATRRAWDVIQPVGPEARSTPPPGPTA